MVVINLKLDGDGAWPDLDLEKLIHVTSPIGICTLPAGMESGKPSVAIRIDLPDGRTVVAETTVSLFLIVAAAMRGKYGDI